jgi:hypothetical protein
MKKLIAVVVSGIILAGCFSGVSYARDEGWYAAGGFVGGMILGSAMTRPRYYYPAPYYTGYSPYYYGSGYYYPPRAYAYPVYSTPVYTTTTYTTYPSTTYVEQQTY